MPRSRFGDRVKETTTTTGTGNVTLAGAVAQFQAFSDRFLVDSPFYYAIVGQSGTEWEVGMGHLSGSTTLVRDEVYQSSNADALVNFSSGTKDVFCTITAHRANDWNTTGKTMAQAMGAAMP
jgi:hypothetical protein